MPAPSATTRRTATAIRIRGQIRRRRAALAGERRRRQRGKRPEPWSGSWAFDSLCVTGRGRGYDPEMSRAEDAARRAELEAAAVRAEAAQAQVLIDAFLARGQGQGNRAGAVAGHPLHAGSRSRPTSAAGTCARTRRLAIGDDGAYYILTVPGGLKERLRGVTLKPSPPPLIVGKGGRDGDTGGPGRVPALAAGGRLILRMSSRLRCPRGGRRPLHLDELHVRADHLVGLAGHHQLALVDPDRPVHISLMLPSPWLTRNIARALSRSSAILALAFSRKRRHRWTAPRRSSGCPASYARPPRSRPGPTCRRSMSASACR